jgi:hypothetical protein
MAPSRFTEENGNPIAAIIASEVQIGEDGNVPGEANDLIAATVAVMRTDLRPTLLKKISSGIAKWQHRHAQLKDMVDMTREGGDVRVLVTDSGIFND